ncbi:hypothetical protein HanIR_Chr13g0634621 [Helianthus annuus]|nr:hypothetical protein HanIR_Chr13g0634621 [Helianthus annuus]
MNSGMRGTRPMKLAYEEVVSETLLHSSGTLMEESGGLHRAMLCCSRQIE